MLSRRGAIGLLRKVPTWAEAFSTSWTQTRGQSSHSENTNTFIKEVSYATVLIPRTAFKA